jgi:hypothetical protein
MVTAAILNAQIKDNLTVLSTHAHAGTAGNGASELVVTSITNQASINFGDAEANPSSAGQIQRNGNELRVYTNKVVELTADAAAATPSPRSLGTGATQAATGDHTHT